MTDVEPATNARAARPADVDAVFDLVSMMALTFVPERRSFARSYHALLDDPRAHLLVVDVDEQVGGYLLGFEHVALFANGLVAWVEEIAVHAGLRRRRLGALLMDTFERSIRARDGRLVALATTRAGDFYEALGYTEHATYYRKLLTRHR